MADILDMSARITRIPVPIASPGSCAICGTPDHPEGFAATDNFDFEFYGTVYFCGTCVGDYARVFGYMSPKEVESLKETLTVQSEQLEVLRRSVVNLENILDAYANYRPDAGLPSHRDAGVAFASAYVAPTLFEGEGSEDKSSDGSSESGESTDGAVNESASVEGRTDVHSATAELTDLSDILDL